MIAIIIITINSSLSIIVRHRVHFYHKPAPTPLQMADFKKWTKTKRRFNAYKGCITYKGIFCFIQIIKSEKSSR